MPEIFASIIKETDRAIAITGAGGKTSLMFLLAHALRDSGRKVISSTSTRIQIPTAKQSNTVVLAAEKDFQVRLERGLRRSRHVTVAHQILPDNKLEGCTPDTLKHIFNHSSASAIIIEADGARGLSLKAPAENEPVVPDWADVHIAVAALDCLGQPLTKTDVFRPELVATITGLQLQESITVQAFAHLAVHPQGMFKSGPPAARSYCFLNKAENKTTRAMARQIIAMASHLQGNTFHFWVYGSILRNICIIRPAQ
ncbi:MAG: putative selenium-dependent hydroxylase accessory protein YqeC [Desulfobulbus sp.]|nr:MAG: putative selenium-dependent hydroxylase accessory protein YqeC [Desulfobulbus sp.]